MFAQICGNFEQFARTRLDENATLGKKIFHEQTCRRHFLSGRPKS